MNYCYTPETPIGRLLVAGNDNGLYRIGFCTGKDFIPEPGWEENTKPFKSVLNQLEKYFNGRLKRFSVKLCVEGTPFQEDVWAELQKIPYGRTISYVEIARRIGRPKAARAVGGAVGKNPIPVIIPCHRVIGKDGSLTGFGGGLPIKTSLLNLEKSR